MATGVDHIALLGNFLPRKCGIATFTTDTYTALRARFPDLKVDVYAMDDHPGRYEYPEAVVGTVPQHDRAAYVEAGRKIADSGAQARGGEGSRTQTHFENLEQSPALAPFEPPGWLTRCHQGVRSGDAQGV